MPTKVERVAIEAMTAEFRRSPGWKCRETNASRHRALEITDPFGNTHKITVAGSPRSDAKCQANFRRQQARRLIRDVEARYAH